MIPLSDAAIQYGIDEVTIRNWAGRYNIDMFRSGGIWMVNETDLDRVVALNAIKSFNELYLAKEIEIRQEEISQIILGLDDLAYLLRSSHKIAPLLRVVINEIALLIPDNLKRCIFMDVNLKMSLSDVAKKYDLPYNKACYLFECALKCVNNNLGFIVGYQDTINELELKVKKLMIEKRNLQSKIEILSDSLEHLRFHDLTMLQGFENTNQVPLDYVKILSMRIIEDFNFETRVINCLQALGIVTIEDLLRLIKTNGFNKLLNTRNFGKKSLKELKSKLIELGIMDDDESSYLFSYI